MLLLSSWPWERAAGTHQALAQLWDQDEKGRAETAMREGGRHRPATSSPATFSSNCLLVFLRCKTPPASGSSVSPTRAEVPLYPCILTSVCLFRMFHSLRKPPPLSNSGWPCVVQSKEQHQETGKVGDRETKTTALTSLKRGGPDLILTGPSRRREQMEFAFLYLILSY